MGDTEVMVRRVPIAADREPAVLRAWESAVVRPIEEAARAEAADRMRLSSAVRPDRRRAGVDSAAGAERDLADLVDRASRHLADHRKAIPELLRDAELDAERKLGELAPTFRTDVAQRLRPRRQAAREPASRLDLGPGRSVFPPPFELAPRGPNHGTPVVARADADTGELTVGAPADKNSHGLRVATAAIGLCVKPNREGTIVAGTFARYAGSWSVAGFNLSAHTEARLTLTAVADPDGRVVSQQVKTLWSRTTKSDFHLDDPDGWLLTPDPDFQVRFMADPGQRYIVFLSATVSGDQSGEPDGFAGSSFAAELTLKALWFDVELRT